MSNLWLIFSFLIGLSVGSFLNCLIYRLHKGETFWQGRSYCPKCKHKLGVLDLIPVFSFIFLRGKCRYCHQKIFWQYPLVELATAILFTVASYRLLAIDHQILNAEWSIPKEVRNQMFLFRDWFFISVLLLIFIYDLKYYLIPDKIILPAIIVVLTFDIILSYYVLKYCQNFEGLNFGNLFCLDIPIILNFLLAAVVGGGFFLVQFLLSKGRWIGGGDIRLGLLMGLMLGWPGIFLALFLAYIIGAIVGVGLIITKKKGWQSQVPFGPFLTGATIFILLFG